MALGAMFLIAPLGAATGRRMQAIRRTLQDQAHGASVIEPMNDRFLRLSLNIRSWILAGIILLMTAKPDLRPSLIIIAVCTGLGILATLVGGRRHTGFQRTDAKAPTTSA